MIEVQQLKKSFGDLQVLKGIDLTVNNGEVLSVIGSSGSGKSTLLYCINALESIDSGVILVDGTSVHDTKTNINDLRQNIGMVFQQFNTFPHLTAQENVALALRKVKKLPKNQAMQLAAEKLDHVGLGDKIKNFPSALSGGQQQRVAIARTLIRRPCVLLLDEPTAALDSQSEKAVVGAIRKAMEYSKSMVMVTHRLGVVRALDVNRVIVLEKGEIAESGHPEELLRMKDGLYASIAREQGITTSMETAM